MSDRDTMRGITFAKQYPSAAEPVRGLFVRSQVRATAHLVDWEVVVPIPWLPRWAVPMLHRPYVRGSRDDEGIRVTWAPYPVLPRRLLYGAVGRTVARASRRAFDAAVDRLAPQFVHAHALYPSGAAAVRLAARHDLPVVVTVHGSDLYTNLEAPSWRAELDLVARSAARVICVSSALAEDCRAELPVESERVLVVPDTYDAQTFRFSGTRTRAADAPVRLVAVGRFSPEKGFDLLLESLGLLRARGLAARLTLIGSGGRQKALEGLAAEHDVSGSVVFAGNVSRQALAAAYHEADMFVLPSRREGFGVALVEALATGLPAVATRSGGPADIVGTEDGLLVQADDAAALADGIAELGGRLDEYDGAAIAERARRRFGPDVVAQQLADVYEQIVAEGARSHG